MAKQLGKPQSNSDVINNQPKVLLIGYGWVGQYMGKYFTTAHYTDSTDKIRRVSDNEVVVPHGIYDLAIIGVPTPMNPESGKCDISIVEKSVDKWRNSVDYFLIKSTVEIGTTDYLAGKYDVKIAMSPEYVGETLGHPLLEARRDAFQIIGSHKGIATAIAEMFYTVLHANAPIFTCSAVEAEIIKYCENMWIKDYVDYWNDVYDIARTFGASFNSVREGLVLDPRKNRTHSLVYSNNRGWSGKCLPKDMSALAYSMRMMGKPLVRLERDIENNVLRRSGIKSTEKLIPDKPIWREDEKNKTK